MVVTGSFNFTKAAEDRNAENLLIMSGKEISARYLGNWRVHQRDSMPYSKREASNMEFVWKHLKKT
jgi:phosphatidylserine/phosphatidylglycerophosphate/cardiolipin synthase-like enzyme